MEVRQSNSDAREKGRKAARMGPIRGQLLGIAVLGTVPTTSEFPRLQAGSTLALLIIDQKCSVADGRI